MKTHSCLACGDSIALRKDGDLATCLSCGSSYVRKKETLEKVEEHFFLPVCVEEAEVYSKGEVGAVAQLVFLPFWALSGSYLTKFVSCDFKEALLSLERRSTEGRVEDDSIVYIPACRTEPSLGQSIPVAMSKEFDRCYLLKEGEPQKFDRSALQSGHWYSGSKSEDRAREEAARYIGNLHRIRIEKEYGGADIRYTFQHSIQTARLIHRPFWVLRGHKKTVVVDAFSGEVLEPGPEQAVQYTANFRANRFYTTLRFGLGFGGAFLCLIPAFAATFLSRTPQGVLLTLSSLALLFCMRVFIFAIFSPYRMMVQDPGTNKMGVFHLRMFSRRFDDPDGVFWACFVGFFLPMVIVPLCLLYSGLITPGVSFLGILASLGTVAYLWGSLPLIPLVVFGSMIASGVAEYILRENDIKTAHSVVTNQWLGVPAFLIVVIRTLLTLLISIPILLFGLMVDFEVLFLPAIKSLF
jgi:hypothetical protein